MEAKSTEMKSGFFQYRNPGFESLVGEEKAGLESVVAQNKDQLRANLMNIGDQSETAVPFIGNSEAIKIR